MSRFSTHHAAALLFGALICASAAAQQGAPAAKPSPAAKSASAKAAFQPVIEQRAVDLLKAMSERLVAAQSLSFSAIASYEYPSRLGPPIVYSVRYDVLLQRPDKLRVRIPGDGPASEFIIDGKEMVAYAPDGNLVAAADAPPTLEAALKKAYDSAAIYFPFTDLLLPDPYAVISKDAILAYVVGPSSIVGGVKTEMVVWANDDVFLQMWIGVDDKLPRRMRAIFRADPRGLRHDLELSDWKLGPALPGDAFDTTTAKAGQPMPFAVPGPAVPVTPKPRATRPAPKPQ